MSIIKRYSVDEKTGIVAEIPDWWSGSTTSLSTLKAGNTDNPEADRRQVARQGVNDMPVVATNRLGQSEGNVQASDLRRKIAIKVASRITYASAVGLGVSEDDLNLIFDTLTDGLLTRTDDELLSLLEVI